MITPGSQAPDFNLPDTRQNMVSLGDHKGKNVVLLFFPFAYTSVCTRELCHARDNLSSYESLNAHVLGISVDPPATLKAFQDQHNINFPLLSDFNKEAIRSYDCMYEVFGKGLRGVAKRSAFVIDANGIVQYAEVLENAGELPDFSKIAATLEKL